MNSKRSVLILILILIAGFNVDAQFLQKTKMIEGEIDIPIISKYPDGTKHYFINSKVGYFVLDNLTLGLNLETSLYTLDANRRTELGTGPFFRYYISKNRIFGFAHFSYLGKLVMFNTAVRNEYQSNIQPGFGFGYMLTPTVGINALFKYDFFHTNDEFTVIQNYTSSSINICLQIYLPLKSN